MLKHFRNYASAGLIGSLIGLVTFPLLTRNLSVDAYGWLGLVSVTVTVFIGIGKLGMQTAMLRFFGEARAQGERQLADLMGTMAGATLLLAGASLVLWLLYTAFVVPLLPDGQTAVPLFYVAAALVPIKVVFSIASSVLKADQRSGVLGTLTIIEKALKLSFIVLIVTALGVSSEKVMASTVVVELITLLLVLYLGRQYLRDAQPHLSRSKMKPLIAFGLPAMTAELITVLLETGDRYVVQAYLGSVELGHYSAAVNICLYLEFVLILSLQSAIVPHYVKLFEERGREATLAFLNTTLRYYFAVALGIFAVFSATAPVLLILLAGERYEPGVVVIIWFAAGFVALGSVSIAAAGIYIDKRTRALVRWGAVAFVVNITLNVLLVPVFGLIAAGISTFVALSIQCLGVYREGYRTLPVAPPLATVGVCLIAALAALLAATSVQQGYGLGDLFAVGTVSTLTYVVVLLTLSGQLRSDFIGYLRGRLGAA